MRPGGSRKGSESNQSKKNWELDQLSNVVFDVPSEGAKPGGEFKRFIEILAQHVGTTFSDDPHIASKALRDGVKPEFKDVQDLSLIHI